MIYILFLSVVVIYADWRLTAHNWGAIWNGVGCIPLVLNGTAKQPMQYRILVPWLCSLWREITSRGYKRFYMGLRWFSIIFALYSANLWFNSQHYTALLALFFIAAAIYDYTDGYLEVGFYSLFFYLMTTQPAYHYEMLFVLTIVATLNRETSVFMPIMALLSQEWLLGIGLCVSFAIGYMIPRVVYGSAERYCKFNMVSENIRRIKDKIMLNEYILFFILLVLIGIGLLNFQGNPFEIGMGLMFLSLLVPCVWAEIRCFKPVMLILIPMIMK